MVWAGIGLDKASAPGHTGVCAHSLNPRLSPFSRHNCHHHHPQVGPTTEPGRMQSQPWASGPGLMTGRTSHPGLGPQLHPLQTQAEALSPVGMEKSHQATEALSSVSFPRLQVPQTGHPTPPE